MVYGTIDSLIWGVLRYSPVTSMMPRVQFDVTVLSFSMLMR